MPTETVDVAAVTSTNSWRGRGVHGLWIGMAVDITVAVRNRLFDGKPLVSSWGSSRLRV